MLLIFTHVVSQWLYGVEQRGRGSWTVKGPAASVRSRVPYRRGGGPCSSSFSAARFSVCQKALHIFLAAVVEKLWKDSWLNPTCNSHRPHWMDNPGILNLEWISIIPPFFVECIFFLYLTNVLVSFKLKSYGWLLRKIGNLPIQITC